MAIEGSLDLFQLPEILQLISHQTKTGILTIQGETDIIAISFDRGRIVAADALNQTLEEALGEVLASQGLVAPADFLRVSTEHQAGESRLVDLLVERKIIDRPQLLKALRLHIFRLLTELLAWRSGEFKFYSGEEVAFEEGFKPISVEELLIRSVEEAAGEGHPTIPDSRSIYEAVAADRPVRVKVDEEGPTIADPSAIWLTGTEKGLLDQLATGYNVAALVKKTGLDEYKVRYTLHRLLELGLARRRTAVSAPAPAAAGPTPASLPPPAPAPRPEPVLTELPPPPQALEPVIASPLESYLGPALALVSALALLIGLIIGPGAVWLPFRWQGSERADHEQRLVDLARGALDRANQTYYLAHGRFSRDAQALVDAGLLSERERRLSAGWQASGLASTELEGSAGPSSVATGNFLLDPPPEGRAQASKGVPLVLID